MILKITHENPLWGWGARAQKKEIRKEFKDIYGTTKEDAFKRDASIHLMIGQHYSQVKIEGFFNKQEPCG